MANRNSRQEGGIRANGGSLSHQRAQELAGVTLAARIRIVGERRIGADENIVFDGDSVPELHTALDRHSVADMHIVFDERLIADIAVRADDSAWQHVGKRPDPGSTTDRGALHNRGVVPKEP